MNHVFDYDPEAEIRHLLWLPMDAALMLETVNEDGSSTWDDAESTCGYFALALVEREDDDEGYVTEMRPYDVTKNELVGGRSIVVRRQRCADCGGLVHVQSTIHKVTAARGYAALAFSKDAPEHLFYFHDGDTWIGADNSGEECCIKRFDDETDCLLWLWDAEACC